jgi:hypothetical protein
MLLYTVIVIPIRLAFSTVGPGLFHTCMDILFMIDVVVNFFLAYYDNKGRLQTRLTVIARRYVTSTFIFDLVSAIPLEAILPHTGAWIEGTINSNSRGSQSAAKTLKIVRLSRLVRLWRIFSRRRAMERAQEILSKMLGCFGEHAVRIISTALTGIMVAHVCCCVWLWIGDLDKHNPYVWTGLLDFWDDLENEERYIYAFYFVTTTLATVGYGDITPRTVKEVGFVIFLQICGTTLFALLTATVASIILENDQKSHEVKRKLKELSRLANDLRLSSELRTQLMTEMTQIWTQDSSEERIKDILSCQVPLELQCAVSMETNHKFVESCAFLQHLSAIDERGVLLVPRLVLLMQLKEFGAGEDILLPHRQMTAMIFVRRGSVTLYTYKPESSASRRPSNNGIPTSPPVSPPPPVVAHSRSKSEFQVVESFNGINGLTSTSPGNGGLVVGRRLLAPKGPEKEKIIFAHIPVGKAVTEVNLDLPYVSIGGARAGKHGAEILVVDTKAMLNLLKDVEVELGHTEVTPRQVIEAYFSALHQERIRLRETAVTAALEKEAQEQLNKPNSFFRTRSKESGMSVFDAVKKLSQNRRQAELKEVAAVHTSSTTVNNSQETDSTTSTANTGNSLTLRQRFQRAVRSEQMRESIRKMKAERALEQYEAQLSPQGASRYFPEMDNFWAI